MLKMKVKIFQGEASENVMISIHRKQSQEVHITIQFNIEKNFFFCLNPTKSHYSAQHETLSFYLEE